MRNKQSVRGVMGVVLCVGLLSGGLAGCASEPEPLGIPTYEGEVSFGSPVADGEGVVEEENEGGEIFEFGEGAGVQVESDVLLDENAPELPQGQEYAGEFSESDLEMIDEGWVPSGRGNLALLPPVKVSGGSVKTPVDSVWSQEDYENVFIKARSLAAKNLVNNNVWRNNPQTGLGERRSNFSFLDASEVGGYMVLDAQGKWYKDTESLGSNNSSGVEALEVLESLVSLPPRIDGSWAVPAMSPFYEFETTAPNVLEEGPEYVGTQNPSIVVGFTVTGYAGFFNDINELKVYKVSRDVEYTMVKEFTGVGGSADWFLWKWNNGDTVVEEVAKEDIQEVGFNGSYGGNDGGQGFAETPIECDADGSNCRIVE